MTEELRQTLESERLSLISKLDSFASPVGDWKITKCYEASLKNEPLPYDIDDLIAQRKAIRVRINEIEEQLEEE